MNWHKMAQSEKLFNKYQNSYEEAKRQYFDFHFYFTFSTLKKKIKFMSVKYWNEFIFKSYQNLSTAMR